MAANMPVTMADVPSNDYKSGCIVCKFVLAVNINHHSGRHLVCCLSFEHGSISIAILASESSKLNQKSRRYNPSYLSSEGTSALLTAILAAILVILSVELRSRAYLHLNPCHLKLKNMNVRLGLCRSTSA
jgi:hypothetical protein